MVSDLGNFYVQPPEGSLEIKACIEALRNSLFLYKKENFDSRVDAIDFIEFQIIDQIDLLQQKENQGEDLTALKCVAEEIKNKLEQVNADLFHVLRHEIRNKKLEGGEFNRLIYKYVSFDPDKNREAIGYDNLDVFINGLISVGDIPEVTKDLEPEMVFYQKTPARIIFELVEKCPFTKEDIFFDLGSGLGQVAILVNLFTGVTTKGIEFEPAFCEYSKLCATQLNLSNVEFINVDARKADYSKGTVFFMYTPFSGNMLQEVLEILKKESQLREIRIFTYGPCTRHVAAQEWLKFSGTDENDLYTLGVFSSRFDS